MNIKNLIQDEDAVSPVIGVILMVAITVILAAVIASFVLGLGDQAQQTTPQSSFSFDFDNPDQADSSVSNPDSLTITHDGGDTIDSTRLRVQISDAEAVDSGVSTGTTTAFGGTTGANQWSDLSSGDVTAGNSITIDGDDLEYTISNTQAADGTTDDGGTAGENEALALEGATVRVTFVGQSGDNSATLATWEGPDA